MRSASVAAGTAGTAQYLLPRRRARETRVETNRTLFELSLLGGTAERPYRRLRPDVDALPWAALRPPHDWSPDESTAARSGFTEAALEEYASVAQHALLVRGLVRAQVPLDLAAMGSAFPVDELAHAEMFARVAAALGGAASLAYDGGELFPRPDHDGEPLDLVVGLALGSCCVFETFSHAQACELCSRAADPFFGALWRRIARDESQHARFGWLLLDWALPDLDAHSRARLGAVARGAIASLREKIATLHRAPEMAFARGAPLGCFDRASHHAFVERAITRRIEARLRRRGLLG